MKRCCPTWAIVSLVAAALAATACSKPSQQETRTAPSSSDAPRMAPGAPPAAAFDACTDKKADDECTVKHDDHEMKGKCMSPPPDATDKRLSCRPDKPPGEPGPDHAPPK